MGRARVVSVLAAAALGLAAAVTPAAPAPTAAAATTPVHLTAAGDFSATGDTARVLDGIRASGSQLTLALGDLSYGMTATEQAWCDFVTSRVGTSHPFQLVAGNHESNGTDGRIDAFAACLPNRLPGMVGTYARQWYADVPQTAPLVRVIMISPSLRFPDGTYSYAKGSARYTWTANAIDSARAAGVRWVVVGFHKPCFSMTSVACDPGADLVNLLVSKKVDLVLTGHSHVYDRTKQLSLSAGCPALVPGTTSAACIADSDSSFTQGAGTVFSTVGTGGTPVELVRPADAERNYFSAYAGNGSNPTWGFLDVTADENRLSARFVPTSGAGFTDAYTITRPTTPAPVTSVAFVGAGHSAPGATLSKSATVPAAAQPGDTLLLWLTRGAAVTWGAPTGVTGWTQVDTVTTGSVTSTLWKKAVVAGDPGRTVRVDATTYTKGVLTVAAYSGVDTAALTAATLARAGDANTATHTSPTVATTSGTWPVTYWGEKSSGTTAWTAPAGVTRRDTSTDTGAGRFSSLLVDAGAAVGAGSYGARTATTDATSSNTVMWTVGLRPRP